MTKKGEKENSRNHDNNNLKKLVSFNKKKKTLFESYRTEAIIYFG